jgi:hypothetical protein
MGLRWLREGHYKHVVSEMDWIEGELRELVNEFETLALAHEYARSSSSQSVKLYDGWGQLLMHQQAALIGETYAG